jgi:hypothetical protein
VQSANLPLGSEIYLIEIGEKPQRDGSSAPGDVMRLAHENPQIIVFP